MGFWAGFGRLLAGKPVFEAQNDHDGSTNEHSLEQPPVLTPPQPTVDVTHGGLLDDRGRKVIPEIHLEHVKSYRNGTTMTVEAWITNRSDLAIRLDDCQMLSQRMQVHYQLTPHQSHQIILYRGPLATNTHDDRVRLTFRILANTDEFEIDYWVKFYPNSDGTYMIEELRPNGSTRDI